MSKITDEALEKELLIKNLKLHPDSDKYKNLDTLITVECINGHKLVTTLKSIRSINFVCPMCIGNKSNGLNGKPLTIPEKVGYRIVALDNATQRMGVSIFDDGKLVYYGLLTFTNINHIKRLNEIRDVIEKVIIPSWKPDFIQFEDILYKDSYVAYEVLAKLIGLLEMSCDKFNITFNKVKSSVWRSHFGINGKNRVTEKTRAIELIKNMYNIDVNDDVAEAILIGKYRSDIDRREKNVDRLF